MSTPAKKPKGDEKYVPMWTALATALQDPTTRERLCQRHNIAKASAASVIALTEYEDGKVARILTVVAFLSAIVGAIFTRFQTVYPYRAPFTADYVHVAYISFFVYAMLVVAAAGWLIYSIRPTFNAPKTWVDGNSTVPQSLFFYQKIVEVRPQDWAEVWLDEPDVKARAAANHVNEAYLVADKIAVKLHRVKWGVWALIWAMIFLVVFVVSVGLAFFNVAPSPT